MAVEWTDCSLADACKSIDYGLTASATDSPVGPKFLRITDIVSGHIDWTTVPHVGADEKTAAKYRLHDGDIVLARTGASTGASAYVKNPPSAVFASYLVRLHVKPEYDPRFLAYYLRSDKFWTFIRGVLGDKSAQPNASASTMTRAPVRVPRVKAEQRAIAHILGTLDDKIELNRRMSETLEAMARALFKSWFVDFDTVRARADGWAFEDMGRHVELSRGFSYDGASIAAGGLPFHNLNSIYEGGGYKFDGIKSLSGDFDDRCAVAPGDIIVANTEQGHDRLLLGSAALIPQRYGPRTPFSHHLYRVRVRPRSPLRPVYVLHLLNVPWTHDLVSRYGNGTTVNMLPMDALALPQIAVPPASLITRFEAIVLPLHHRTEAAVLESETLAAIRDALLPRLISGDLGVKDAESFVGKGA